MSRPRLFLTETVRWWPARICANRSIAWSEGRSNGIPGAAFNGIRFTLDLTPDSSLASRRASSGESLTPAALQALREGAQDYLLKSEIDSNVVLRACRDAGFQPRIAYQSDDYFAIQGLVASGMGVALVPGLALVSTREDVAVRPLRGRPPYRRIGAVYEGEATGPLAVMLDCLRDAVRDYQHSAPISAVAAA